MGGRGQDGEYYRLVLHGVHVAQEKNEWHIRKILLSIPDGIQKRDLGGGGDWTL